MYARVNTFEGPPDRVDEAVRNVREQILPQLQRQDGFEGLIGLVERQDGRLIGVTLWESEEAMRASEEEAKRLRGETARGGDQTIAGVQRCEVALFEVSS